MVDAPFVEEIIRHGHDKVLRHERANHKHDKIKVYSEQSSFEDQKQNPQNYYLWQNRYDENCRFKILRFLQNKTRGPSRTFKQTLSF